MCLVFRPDKNKVIMPQIKTIKDVPRSGCFNINTIGRKIIIKAKNNFLISISLSSDIDRYQARVIGKIIFKISETWKEKPNKIIHLVAPFESCPQNKVKSNISIEAIYMYGVNIFNLLVSKFRSFLKILDLIK